MNELDAAPCSGSDDDEDTEDMDELNQQILVELESN